MEEVLIASILITGATGSFGNAFVRFLLKGHPEFERIAIFSRDELKQSEMRAALEREFPERAQHLRWFIGDVRDRDRVTRALQGIDWVVHAAALKRVEVAEYNPDECVETNVNGTRNVNKAAVDAGVQRVVALSSDKAVAPCTMYGKSKAVMETLVVQANVYSHTTRFSCVRYGNVWASRGSVLQVWREQAPCGTIMLTTPDSTRFFLTLDDACRLVWMAFERMQGGEVFVPKPVSMQMGDLATVLYPNAYRCVSGLRQGEKKHELLISRDEASRVRDLGSHYVIVPAACEWRVSGEWPGEPVPAGFSLASNDAVLDVEAIRAWLAARGLS